MRPITLAVLVVTSLLASGCADHERDGPSTAADQSPGTAATPDGCDRPEPVTPGTERIELAVDGTTREVERVVPPSYDGTTPHPLVLDLHGTSSTIEQQGLFSGMPEAAAARGYIVLTPQALPSTISIRGEELRTEVWNLGSDAPGAAPDASDAHDDVAFLTQLIDTTSSELCVDPDRVYVTGNSNGGGMAAALACALPGRFAAIAPVSGINLAPSCSDLEAVSVVAFHGDADPLVPYTGESTDREFDGPSVEARVADFAGVAECDEAPERSSPFDDIVHRRWAHCRGDVDVELYTVLGGGHTWPGMLNYVDVERLAELGSTSQRLVDLAGTDLATVAGHMTTNLEATEVMLDFFGSHPRS